MSSRRTRSGLSTVVFLLFSASVVGSVAWGREVASATRPKAYLPPPGVRLVSDVRYLGPENPLTLDLYLPAESSTPARKPAIVWMHGNQGHKTDSRERNVCGNLAAAGYVCASIEYGGWDAPWYRRGAQYRQNVLNAKDAVRFIRVHASEYGIDPQRIGIFGASAGANLALLAGFTADGPDFSGKGPYANISCAVKVVGDFYGTCDNLTEPMPLRWRIIAIPFYFQQKKYSPVTYITPKTPAVFIAHGTSDPLQPFSQSVELDSRLSQAGVPHAFVRLEGVGHSFDLSRWNGKPLPIDLKSQLLVFLSRNL